MSKTFYCISVLRQSSSGETLIARDYRFSALTVLGSLKDLIDTCHSTYRSLPDGQKITPVQRKRILTLTSQVWKTVERTATLPKTEGEAFVIAWKSMLEMLQDGLDEVDDLSQRPVLDKGKARAVEAPTGANGTGRGIDGEGDEDEDEFDEFVESDDEEESTPLEYPEARIVQATLQLLKLVKALFKKIHASHALLASNGEEGVFQGVYSAGQALVGAQDDLASVLEPPIRIPEAGKMALAYRTAALALCDASRSKLVGANGEQDLAQAVAELQINGSGRIDPAKALLEGLQKWLTACRQQIEKAAGDLEESCPRPGR